MFKAHGENENQIQVSPFLSTSQGEPLIAGVCFQIVIGFHFIALFKINFG